MPGHFSDLLRAHSTLLRLRGTPGTTAEQWSDEVAGVLDALERFMTGVRPGWDTGTSEELLRALLEADHDR